MKKRKLKKKVERLTHSFATKLTWANDEEADAITDIKSVAKSLLNWGEIPKNLNDIRAKEISLLAHEYLKLSRKK